MIFYILYFVLIASIQDDGRKLGLYLPDYCYDEITGVFIQEDHKITQIANFNITIENERSILFFYLPIHVKSKFNIIIVAEPQIIKIGNFFIEKDESITKSDLSNISCRYGSNKEDFTNMLNNILQGEDVKGKYGDDLPAVLSHVTERGIFIDLSRFETQINKEKDPTFIEYVSSSESKTPLTFKPSFEFIKNFNEIQIYDFNAEQAIDSKYCLYIPILDSNYNSFAFFVNIPLKTEENLRIGTIYFNPDKRSYKGFNNGRVGYKIQDKDYEKLFSTSKTSDHSEEEKETSDNNQEKKFSKPVTQKIASGSKNSSDSGTQADKTNKSSTQSQKEESSLFDKIFKEYFWQVLLGFSIFFFLLIILVVVLKK